MLQSIKSWFQNQYQPFVAFADRVPVNPVNRLVNDPATQIVDETQIVNQTLYRRIGIACALAEKALNLLALLSCFGGGVVLLRGGYLLGRVALGYSQIQQGMALNMLGTACVAFGAKLIQALRNHDNFTTLPLKKIRSICSRIADQVIHNAQLPSIGRFSRLFVSPNLVPTVLLSDLYHLTEVAFYQKYTTTQVESHPQVQQIVTHFRTWLNTERAGLPEDIRNGLPTEAGAITLRSIFTLLRDHPDWHTSVEWRQALSRLVLPHYASSLLHHTEFCNLLLSHLGFGRTDVRITQDPPVQDFIFRIRNSTFDSNDTQLAGRYQIGWLANYLLQQNEWDIQCTAAFFEVRPIVSNELWMSCLIDPNYLNSFVANLHAFNIPIPNFRRDYEQLCALFTQPYNQYCENYPVEDDLTAAIIQESHAKNRDLRICLEAAGCIIEDLDADNEVMAIFQALSKFSDPLKNRGEIFRAALRAWCNDPLIKSICYDLCRHIDPNNKTLICGPVNDLTRSVHFYYGEFFVNDHQILSGNAEELFACYRRLYQRFTNTNDLIVVEAFNSGAFDPNDFEGNDALPPLEIPWMVEEYLHYFPERIRSYFNNPAQLSKSFQYGLLHPESGSWRDQCVQVILNMTEDQLDPNQAVFSRAVDPLSFYRYIASSNGQAAHRLARLIRYQCEMDETYSDRLTSKERLLIASVAV